MQTSRTNQDPLLYQIYYNHHSWQNQNVIAGANETAAKVLQSKSIIFGKGTDFIELELDRTETRVMSVLIDLSMQYFWGMNYSFWTVNDAFIDYRKIAIINDKLSKIKAVQIHPGTYCDLSALKAQQTEIAIYENIKKYTQTARNLKLLEFIVNTANVLGSRKLDGFIYGGIATICLHWLAAGSKLEGINQTLAQGQLNPFPTTNHQNYL